MPLVVARNVSPLKSVLDDLTREFDLRYLSPDPLELVHEYRRPEDQEVVGLVAASLAYGNVKAILRGARQVLAVLGDSPHAAVRELTPREAVRRLEGFTYRFNSQIDMARFLLMIREVLRRHGSLQNLFLRGYRPSDADIGPALDHFAAAMLALRFPQLDRIEVRRELVSRVAYFLPRPCDGSACKRLNMFLRWMVRPRDGVDLGLWQGISPAQLIIPLDTHVARLSRKLGLTRRTAADWRTACEVTEALKQLDPRDPVRYDFAISRLGILGHCTHETLESDCRICTLAKACEQQGRGGSC